MSQSEIDAMYTAILEAFYATGLVAKGSPEDDPEKVTDFLKYLRGYEVVPESVPAEERLPAP